MNYNLNDSSLIRVRDFQRIQIEQGLTITTIHTPGHTPDHISLWIQESGDLFTGDCVIGGESAQFQDLQAQLESVDKLNRLKGLTRILTGKGSCETNNPYEKLRDFKEYRLKREKEILNIIGENQQISAQHLTKFVYGARFEREDPRHEAGEQNMRAHLRKLLTEGRIIKRDENYALV